MGGGNWDEQLYPASQMPDSALCAENRINKTIRSYWVKEKILQMRCNFAYLCKHHFALSV